MKKKIGLAVLLIAVTMGTAFAIDFKQFDHENDIKVTSVTATPNSGLIIEYKGLKGTIKLGFLVLVVYKNDQINTEYYNSETMLKKDKLETFEIKKLDRIPAEIKVVNIYVGTSKNDIKKGQNYLSIAADAVLSAGAQLPDLENMCRAYNITVEAFSKIDNARTAIDLLVKSNNVFQASLKYKNAKASGKNGDAMAANRELMSKNLDFIESVGSLGMNTIQQKLLSAAVEGAKKAMKAMQEANDRTIWTGVVAETDDSDLGGAPYINYATTALQLVGNGVPLSDIRTVLEVLVKAENKDVKLPPKKPPNAKEVGRKITTEQKFYEKEVKVYLAEETKTGIKIPYTSTITSKKGLVFIARCTYSDGSVRTAYNKEGWLLKNIAFEPKFTIASPTSIKSVIVFIGASKEDADAKLKQFEDKDKVTVTFDSNGGSAPNPATKTVKTGDNYGKIFPVVSRAGHSFAGWFTAVSGGTSVINSTTVTSKTNHTLYARWTAVSPPPPKKLSRADYQNIIQSKCKFNNAADVWVVMDKHSSANDLYRIWANSYPNPLLAKKPNKPDKDIIQERCGFSDPNGVWAVVAKHKSADSLLKVWADSYYQGLRK